MEKFEKPRGYKNCTASEIDKVELEKTYYQQIYNSIANFISYYFVK